MHAFGRRTDGRTDGQRDRILIARPRLHFMQRSKTRVDNAGLNSEGRKRRSGHCRTRLWRTKCEKCLHCMRRWNLGGFENFRILQAGVYTKSASWVLQGCSCQRSISDVELVCVSLLGCIDDWRMLVCIFTSKLHPFPSSSTLWRHTCSSSKTHLAH